MSGRLRGRAWLGEAERYLQRELGAGRLADLGGFSVCERCTDSSPPRIPRRGADLERPFDGDA